jgi:flagella basal body P-ring formation protein FlgA
MASDPYTDESGTGLAMRAHLEALHRAAQEDVAQARTPQEQIAYRERRIEGLRLDERDSGADHAAEIARLEGEIEAIRAQWHAQHEAQFAAEWTREVTISRRAAWNALVKSGKLGRGGQVRVSDVRKQEIAQGWTVEDLKKAVALHSL